MNQNHNVWPDSSKSNENLRFILRRVALCRYLINNPEFSGAISCAVMPLVWWCFFWQPCPIICGMEPEKIARIANCGWSLDSRSAKPRGQVAGFLTGFPCVTLFINVRQFESESRGLTWPQRLNYVTQRYLMLLDIRLNVLERESDGNPMADNYWSCAIPADG